MFSSHYFKALEMAVVSKSAFEIMRCYAESSFAQLHTSTIQYFRVNSENMIELSSSYGENLASLKNFKHLSRQRKLPVVDSINTGNEIYFSSPEQLAQAYEETRQWDYVPTALIIVPVNKLALTVGCISVTLSEAVEPCNLKPAIESIRSLAYLLQLTDLQELTGIESMVNLNSQTQLPNTQSPVLQLTHESIQDNHTFDAANLEMTDRQYQIARLIAGGSTNSAIARALNFSEATIRYETIKLYQRLRVKNRAQASSRIRELGIA